MGDEGAPAEPAPVKRELGSILIVEDDESISRTLSLILTKLGYRTDTAKTGREALVKADQQFFNILLLDIRLPDMEGLELLAPLKQRHPDLCVIMLTAHASMDSAIRALNEGASAYITKPFSMEEVLATVRDCLEKQHLVLENRRLYAKAQQELAMRKEAEQEREKLREQVYQADRMASLGMMAASVAHEINNPISYLLFNLESLAEDLPKVTWAVDRLLKEVSKQLTPDACTRLLGDAKRVTSADMLDDLVSRAQDALEGARHLRDIVKDLRTFSRAQEDRNVPVSLNKVLEVAVNMAVNEFKYRARLVKEYGDLPTIMANDGRLSQVFLNLLVNAAQSIVEGSVERNEIRIRTWAEVAEVLVEISDTGRGIPPEEVARVFEPFYSTKPEGVGSGLGLSICDNIIRSYGGRIDVQSEPGSGTRFTVRLPQSDTGEYAAVRPPTSEEEAVQPEVRHGRILMIDDEPNFGTSIQRVLMDEFEVVVATSGAAGKEILEQDTGFGLILCDLLMPTVSGMDLYEWLESRSPELASRVVFVTGGAFTPHARSFLQRVPNLHLEKPFDVSYIRSLLRELLARRSA